jgi:hypothetical protein
MGIVARCCDAIAMSEEGRLGLSGPDVIEATKGVEELDAADRGLVWRTYGGKHRYLLGEADLIVDDDLAAFRVSARSSSPGRGRSTSPRSSGSTTASRGGSRSWGAAPTRPSSGAPPARRIPTGSAPRSGRVPQRRRRCAQGAVSVAELLDALFPDGHAVRKAGSSSAARARRWARWR